MIKRKGKVMRMRKKVSVRSVIKYRRKGVYTPRKNLKATKASAKPEVKYKDLGVQDASITTIYSGVANTDIVNSAGNSKQLIINMFDNITTGTESYNRVGSKIYVKHIQLRMCIWLCNASTTENLNTCLVRVSMISGRAAANASYTGVFPYAANYKLFLPYNRRNYYIHYDHIIPMTAPWPSITNSTDSRSGKIIFHTVKVPVNRVVTFSSDGTVKEDRDTFNLLAFADVPETASNSFQACCCHANVRIYFTDV